MPEKAWWWWRVWGDDEIRKSKYNAAKNCRKGQMIDYKGHEQTGSNG
jgi:hypothetical protein